MIYLLKSEIVAILSLIIDLTFTKPFLIEIYSFIHKKEE